MIALDPSSTRLYVGRSTLSASTTSGFVVLDRATMAITEVATPFNVPHAMAVTPDGQFVLTASLTGNQVAVYNPRTEDLAIQPVPGGPHELIHFAVLGAHHGGRAAASGAVAGMDHGTMDHSAMDHGAWTTARWTTRIDDHGTAAPGAGATAMHAYEATLTSKSTNTVLFFSLSAAGDAHAHGDGARRQRPVPRPRRPRRADDAHPGPARRHRHHPRRRHARDDRGPSRRPRRAGRSRSRTAPRRATTARASS